MIGKQELYDWGGANVWLFKQINSISGSYYDLIISKITLLGEKSLLPYFIFTIAAFVFISFMLRVLRKKAGNRHYFHMWLGIFAVIFVGFVVNYGTIKFLKEHFSYTRPYATLPSGEVRHLEEQDSEKANESFPSGHTAIITTLVVALWPALSGKMRFLGGSLIFAVAWSRIALGVHFPVDVLYSFIITFFEIIIVRLVIYRTLNRLFGLRC